MEKKKLQDFIAKYHLGGLVDSAKIKCEEGSFITAFTTPDKSNIGYVKMDGFEVEDFEIAVFTTAELIRLINVLDDEIKFELGEKGGRINSLRLKDKKTLVSYVLADLSVIQDAPNTNELPDFETVIEITPEFIDNFIKSYGSLANCKLFAVESIGKNTLLTMNYSNDNTSNIKFPVKMKKGSKELPDAMCFSADFFKSILSVNKTTKEASLEISTEGLARITFKDEMFEGTYYMLAIELR